MDGDSVTYYDALVEADAGYSLHEIQPGVLVVALDTQTNKYYCTLILEVVRRSISARGAQRVHCQAYSLEEQRVGSYYFDDEPKEHPVWIVKP